MLAARRLFINATVAPPTGTPLSDDFNRTSNTTLNPASDGGSWTIDGGTWGTETTDPAAYLVSTTGGSTIDGQYLARRDFGSYAVDMTISNFRVVSTIPNSKIWIAYDPATQSGYRFSFTSLSTGANIERYEAGVTTTIGLAVTMTSWFNSSFAVLRFTHDGAGNLSIYQNGALKGTRTDPDPTLTGTWVGMSSPGTSRDFWQAFSAVNI